MIKQFQFILTAIVLMLFIFGCEHASINRSNTNDQENANLEAMEFYCSMGGPFFIGPTLAEFTFATNGSNPIVFWQIIYGSMEIVEIGSNKITIHFDDNFDGGCLRCNLSWANGEICMSDKKIGLDLGEICAGCQRCNAEFSTPLPTSTDGGVQ